MASKDALALSLKANGDTVGHLLDTYKSDNPRLRPNNYCEVIKDMKLLLPALQALEDACVTGTCDVTRLRVKTYIKGMLDDCDEHTKLIQARIKCNTLREDASLSSRITTLKEDIEIFLQTQGRSNKVSEPGPSQTALQEIEVLKREKALLAREKAHLSRDLEAAQVEVDKLTSILESNNLSLPKHDDEPKLQHIKRLHKAITSLGLRRPRAHGLDTWEELKGELPTMLDHIKGINQQLQETEESIAVESSAIPQSRTAHRHAQSESHATDQALPYGEFNPRVPSPTESNVSARRDPFTKADKVNKGWKRRNTAPKSRSGQSDHG